ncbi:hypothetical protein AMJ83_00575 [candidate division WOR_3 bacterium SM23_42]|uniref:Uncharacterized protein n=1 Tax=candidate division WOR_3 bacterium SM23_42 TaxID=1703779 RepID=A0A0S8FWJ4_UNCW3|nr:MAG: hypothetical protein AMJ83_00575 [candidate division WOR_3 bacterium SM23_42]
MKKLLVIIIGLIVVLSVCTQEEEPLFCHLYGYIILASDSVTGVNGITLRIWDLDPEDPTDYRRTPRETVTRTEDSLPGFFEMDSVVYGTDKNQGSFVRIVIDSLQNPGWTSQVHWPFIEGEVDTAIVYIVD